MAACSSKTFKLAAELANDDEEKESKKLAAPVATTTRNVVFKQGKCGFHLQLGEDKTGKLSEANEQLKVTHVKEESQAYWAGVKPGWIIRTIDGEGVNKDSRTLTFTGTVKKMLGDSIQFLVPE